MNLPAPFFGLKTLYGSMVPVPPLHLQTHFDVTVFLAFSWALLFYFVSSTMIFHDIPPLLITIALHSSYSDILQ